MVIAEVSIIPIGTKSPSVSEYVAKAIKVLSREKDVSYELTAMGTIMGGELDDVLEAVAKMHEAIFDEGVKRVVTTLRIDDRRDRPQTADYKVESVMGKLG